MMKKSVCWKTVLLVLFLFSLVSAFVSGEILGKINTLYGDVKIDAFGINSYLDAIIGDILYNNTVLYFPAGSKAIILLRNKLFNIIATKNNQIIIRYKENQSQILSHHYVAIFDLLKLIPENTEYTSFDFTSAWLMLDEVIRNLFDNTNTEDYASKENPPEMDWDWMIDTDTNKLKMAGDQLKDQNYTGALLTLTNIQDSTHLEIPPGGLEFLKGICFLKLNEYKKAKEQFTFSEQKIKLKEKKHELSYLYTPLLYLLGVLSYVTGEYTQAATYLDLYIENSNPEKRNINISAYSLFVDSCIIIDSHEKAEEFLVKKIAGCMDNELIKELEKLLTTLNSYEAN